MGRSGSQIVALDTGYTHNRWTNGDAMIETFDHAYETVADGPSGYARGHCIAGRTSEPYAPQYAIPCKLPNAFAWGKQVMAFFLAHPKPWRGNVAGWLPSRTGSAPSAKRVAVSSSASRTAA